MTRGGAFTIKTIQLGQRQVDPSHALLEVRASTAAQLDEILDLYLNDPTGWELNSSGDYIQRSGDGVGAQEALISRIQETTADKR